MMEEQFGWRVAEQCPDALRILDTEDLHCLRKGRQQAFKEDKPFNISYLFNDNSSFDMFYQYASKNNTIGDMESLNQQKYGISFTLGNSQNSAINGEFNYFSNDYIGNPNTPVAYQLLEGLQPGKNFTWSLLAQKKLTKFLDLNLSYFGRKTETSRTIHSGSIQLKAYF